MDSQLLVVSHSVISLVAILSGAIVVFELLASGKVSRLTALFLVTTGATSLSGYLFERDQVLPSHIVGGVALVVLGITCAALYKFHLSGPWRTTFVFGVVISLWLNVFVLIVQAFLKIAPLHALAPKGSEPPFAIAQGLVFVAFVAVAVLARRRFKPVPSFG